MRSAKTVLTYCVCSLVILCLLMAGCNREKGLQGLVPVKGKITLDGEPIADASITLSPNSTGDEARSCGATSDKDGNFTLQTLRANDGAFPGEYTISVRKMVPDKTYTDEEYAEANAKGVSLKINAQNTLPRKYENAATSGLKATIAKGMAPLEIKLEK